MPLEQQDLKKLIAILLRNRPNFVVVMTDGPAEKKTLVQILKNAGAKVLSRD